MADAKPEISPKTIAQCVVHLTATLNMLTYFKQYGKPPDDVNIYTLSAVRDTLNEIDQQGKK